MNEFGAKITGMDQAMIDCVIEEYVVCAKVHEGSRIRWRLDPLRARLAFNEFLSARTNTRTDEYGGSLANRAKFPIRVIQAIREAMGKDFILEVRVSGDERIEHGMGVEEIAAFSKMIEPLVDLIHVSVGIYRDPVLSGMFNSLFELHGLNAESGRCHQEGGIDSRNSRRRHQFS